VSTLTADYDTALHDAEYEAFSTKLRATFAANVGAGKPVFTTNAEGLFATYLDNLPPELRQVHNCNTCKRFFETYGALVAIDEAGHTMPVMWDENDVPETYRKAVAALWASVRRAQVTGVFYSAERAWGTPVTGDWNHLHVVPPASMVHTDRLLTAGQAMAAKRHEFETLQRALAEFSTSLLESAVNLLKADALYRSERVLGVAEFLLNLQKARASAGSQPQRNAGTWLSVAAAPAGFCHPRSSMIGTLLEDIEAGMSFDQVAARFRAKMAPSQYQRAQAAPSAGAIRQAEKMFSELGLAPALKRRYASLDELPRGAMLWRTPEVKAEPKAAAGIFGHLQAKDAAPAVEHAMPAVTMTWEKFSKTVLPTAGSIEVLVPSTADRFMALVTAADDSAPPILQWDTPEARNAFSWYYASGIDAEMRRRLTQAGGRFEDIDIRCSLMWNNHNDLDLQCLTPLGDHIYFGNKRACRRGGWLDVDMNISGETDKPVENIRWERGSAPEGRYQFFVNLYRQHRGHGPRTPFTVEIEVGGQVFSVVGESLGSNSTNRITAMVKVADFEYVRGGRPTLSASAMVRPAATSPNAWGLTPGSYVPVTAVVRSPNLWGDRPLEQHGQHVFFLMRGCRDTQEGVGRGFFTEMLRSDLRPVRSVLEAYAASAAIDGTQEASACGVGISNSSTGGITLRVTGPNGRAIYKLDRWD
jgi:hypothetical protein